MAKGTGTGRAVWGSGRSSSVRRQWLEALEPRRLLSVNVLTHHGDAANDGLNAAETVLSPGNVRPADFGKQFAAVLDGGTVSAQPLYLQNVNITAAPSPGAHSVVVAATQADGLYALDANTGAVLWHDNFTNITDPTNLTHTSGVTTISRSDIANNPDVGPTLGILATPAVDPGTGVLYLNANTKELRPDGIHFVQRLWAIHLADGSAATAAPAVIADTIANSGLGGPYRYVSGPIVSGTGNNNPAGHPTPVYPNTDGWTSAPGGRSGYVIAFNAIVQMERTAVTLVNGTIYLGFASHGDNGPYYGWILAFDEATLALKAAFNTTPTYEPTSQVQSSTPYQSGGGIWMSGSNIATDGTSLYVVTGNGAFNGSPSNFDAQGFALDHDYADSVLKITLDPNSSPTNQNGNGWGLKVSDYFTPSNQFILNALDMDLGSGGATLLPDSLRDAAGNPMIVVGGKESRIYLLDRNNLGKFNSAYPQASTTADPRLYDRVLGEYPNNGVDQQHEEVYSSAAYLNGNVYLGLHGVPAVELNVASMNTGSIPPGNTVTPTPVKTALSWGYPGETFTISAAGNTNGIVWGLNPGGSDLLAYDANSFVQPIYDSNSVAADSLNGSVHFNVPTVANGMAYVGTSSGTLLGYGLRSSYLNSQPTYFGAPTGLVAASSSPTVVHLGWTDNSSLATEFRVERSTDGSSWMPIALLANGSNSYEDPTVAPETGYFYRVIGLSGINSTAASNVAAVAPPKLLAAVSRKKQAGVGTFDINLPLDVSNVPGIGIEDRAGGPTQIVLSFAGPIALASDFKVATSSGTVLSTAASGKTLTINLSGAANGQTLVLSITGVADAGSRAEGTYTVDVGVLAGDINDDGKVDVTDLGILASHFGAAAGADPTQGDFNGDGKVDVTDLGILATDFGKTLAPPVSPAGAAVPSPNAQPAANIPRSRPAVRRPLPLPPFAPALTLIDL